MSQNEITAKVRELKELQTLIDQAQAEAETIRDELKKYMDENGTEELHADVYRVKYTTVRSNRFDSAALRKDAPGLYEQYTRQMITRRFTIA